METKKKYDNKMRDFLKTLGEGVLGALSKQQESQRVLKPVVDNYLRKPADGKTYGSMVKPDGTLVGSPGMDREGNFTPLIPSVPDELRPDIANAARKYDLPARELSAHYDRESGGYNPDIMSGVRKSSAGATGVAQLMPNTIGEIKKTGYGDFNPNNPKEGIYAGAYWLNELRNRIGDKDFYELLKAYNAGEGNYNTLGSEGVMKIDETRNHINYVKDKANADNIRLGK